MPSWHVQVQFHLVTFLCPRTEDRLRQDQVGLTLHVIPIHKGGDRSLVTNYRPVSLTSVVCKQMEHVIASYLRQVWDRNDWLYEGQHGFRPGYSRESQLITVCQDIADSLDNGDRIDAILIDF